MKQPLHDLICSGQCFYATSIDALTLSSRTVAGSSNPPIISLPAAGVSNSRISRLRPFFSGMKLSAVRKQRLVRLTSTEMLEESLEGLLVPDCRGQEGILVVSVTKQPG